MVEVITGIMLVHSAYKAIKTQIDMCKDVGLIAGHIDQLVEGKEQIDAAAKPTSVMASKWSRMMGAKGVDNEGSLSIGSIAQEKINQKLAEEELRKVRSMVNRRFGPDTWDEILMERDERMKKTKTAAQKQKARMAESIDKWFERAKNALILVGTLIGMFVIWMFYTQQWTL